MYYDNSSCKDSQDLNTKEKIVIFLLPSRHFSRYLQPRPQYGTFFAINGSRSLKGSPLIETHIIN